MEAGRSNVGWDPLETGGIGDDSLETGSKGVGKGWNPQEAAKMKAFWKQMAKV